ncbi:marvel domain-containing protein [Xylaria bambusicola]|uniref:marvel domain-containing protein n=1 Tax=Xylaria bambusicola TaxID=326684 RepID=UPI00200898A3|nr:marvel domain-containing protein [Xylaria bambusicola]KAI0521763.1 marvel domain-containing protein [Xylaria bambusicola]
MRTIVNSILRLAQFFLVLIATALLGNVRANSAHAAAAINFSIFVCALAWVAVLYGLASNFISAVAMPIVSLALDGLSTLFTFIGAVVLSAKLTTVNCAHPGSRSPGWIAYGSDNTQKRCREIQAGLVFVWFLFATFAATLFLTFKEFRRGGGSVGRPSMSQIGV